MHLMGGPVSAETLAEMHAPVAAPAVARFYAESMPQLGWQPRGTNHWLRDGELLHLEIVPDKGHGIIAPPAAAQSIYDFFDRHLKETPGK